MAIDPKDRKFNDALRQRGVRTANAYARKLTTLRAKEVRRVLDILAVNDNVRAWPLLIDMNLNESKYLTAWWKALTIDVGMPVVTAKTKWLLGRDDATIEKPVFERTLSDYAERRAGENIRIVSGTLKDDLKGIVSRQIMEDEAIGIEKLAKAVYKGFEDIALWQARRIAQTEMMIGSAEAGHEAAEALGIAYTKTWAVSGLGNTRDTHLAMDGVTVDQYDNFRLPDCEMRYPHDLFYDPPASEIINCACTCIEKPKD